MTAAHASAITEKPFTEHYAHAGLVAYEGTKMSKSLGNLVLVSKLTEAGHDAAAIRLVVLAHHYRENWEWFAEELDAATARLESWRAAAQRAEDAVVTDAADASDASNYGRRIREAVANDLNTPEAIKLVDEWAAEERPDLGVIDVVDALLGVQLS